VDPVTRKVTKSIRKAGVARSDSTPVAPREWKIHCTFESRKLRIPLRWIRTVISEVLCHAERDVKISEVCELNVLFTDDKRMRVINREYRNKDKATDVLSFPQFQPQEIRGRRKARGVIGSYLGDLVISTDTTFRQAKEFGVTPRDELLRLIVHGILHLCGYDHEGVPAAEAQKMRRRERQIRDRVSKTL
jgi:probable rRNA maturation factor